MKVSSGRPVYVTPSETLALLRRKGIRWRKSLGQHFLVDNNVLLKILDAAEIAPSDVILEVGPGIGSLTKGLADRAASVVAVEVDRRMVACFRENVKAPNVILMEKDALELGPGDVARLGIMPNKLVANLPYNIAVTLVIQLLERFPGLAAATVMVQKEVADRMVAAPSTKDYGGVTLKLAYYGSVRRAFVVPPTVFVPPPRVDSAVVKITRSRSDVSDRSAVFTVIDACFSQRRKMIANTLAGLTDLTREDAAGALRSAGIDPEARPETLSIGDFIKLARTLSATS